MADPIQSRAKEKRLAESLRANLKRRKEQTRGREQSDTDPGDAESQQPLTQSRDDKSR